MRAISFAVLAALIACSPFGSAKASFLSDAWNVITDPLKLNAGTENVIHAVERADLMMKDLVKSLDASGRQVDANIRDYLRQVDDTIDKTFVRGNLTVNLAFDRLSMLETKFFADSELFVKCSVEVTLSQIQTSLAEALNSVGASRPRLVIFGWEIGSVEITAQEIASPIEAYDLLKTAAEKRINSLQPSSPAKTVEFIYGDMQRIADLTRCHYASQNALQLRLQRDIYEYRRQHQVWAGLVK